METSEIISFWAFWTAALVLGYAYLGYPLLSILLGHKRDAVDNEDAPLLPVSILIPAYNEAQVIEEKINNFLSLDYPPELLEMVIADDGSDDNTSAVVQPRVSDRILLIQSEQRRGKAAMMNRLAETSNRPLMLFSDANVMMRPDAVRQLVKAMSQERVGAATGEVRLIGSGRDFRYGELLYYWIERQIQAAESHIGSVMGVDGGMYMLHRDLFPTLPTDTILDDFAVSMAIMRKGFRVCYVEDAKATEGGTPTASQEYARRVRIAAGAVQLLLRGNFPKITQVVPFFQFVSHKLLRWFSPIFLLVTLLTSIQLAETSNLYKTVKISQVILYLAMIGSFLFVPLRETKLGSVLFYFGMSQIALFVGLVKGLFHGQPPQWNKGVRLSKSMQLGDDA